MRKLGEASPRKGPLSLDQRGEGTCHRTLRAWVSRQRHEQVKGYGWEQYSMLEQHKVGTKSGHMGTTCAKVSSFCSLVRRFLMAQNNKLL